MTAALAIERRAHEKLSRSIFRGCDFGRIVCDYPAISAIAAQADSPPYAMAATYKIGGDGGWDYATLSEGRLYVTRTTHTMEIDVATGKVVADIAGQNRSHGVAIVHEARRGFISDGGSGSVLIFDLKTHETLGKVTAAADADGIIYDRASNRVLVMCGDAHQMVAIAPDVNPNRRQAFGHRGSRRLARVRRLRRERQGVRQYRGQGRGRGHRYQTDEGHRAMADRAGSAADRDVDGSRDATPVHRMSKQEADRDERRRRQDRRGLSNRRVR